MAVVRKVTSCDSLSENVLRRLTRMGSTRKDLEVWPHGVGVAFMAEAHP